MSAIRIRGEWTLSLFEQGLELTQAGLPAILIIDHADRARVHGRIKIGRDETEVFGRVKPGSPGVAVLTETSGSKVVSDGLEVILYIPPFWPNIDYKFDTLVGILT